MHFYFLPSSQTSKPGYGPPSTILLCRGKEQQSRFYTRPTVLRLIRHQRVRAPFLVGTYAQSSRFRKTLVPNLAVRRPRPLGRHAADDEYRAEVLLRSSRSSMQSRKLQVRCKYVGRLLLVTSCCAFVFHFYQHAVR